METTNNFDAPEVKLHFLDYWRIIRIRKTVILAVFLLVTITTTVVTLILPKSYSSTVRIEIEKERTDVGGLSQERNALGYDPYWIQTQFEKIQSKVILYQVISNLNLQKIWAEKYQESKLPIDFTYLLLKGQIDVTQYRNTSIIEISVLSEDKSEAATIANEIASVYKDARLGRYRDSSSVGITVLEDQWQKIDLQVSNQQFRVDKLKTDLNISDIEAQGMTFSPTLEPESLRQLNQERIAAQGIYEQLNSMHMELSSLTRPELKEALPTATQDQQLIQLLGQLDETEQQLAIMEETFASQHPEVKTVMNLIAKIEQQINDRIDGILQGIKTKANAQKALVDSYVSEVETAKQKDINEAIRRRPYFQAKRDLESLQLVRDRLGLRIQQETVEAELPMSNLVQVIDPAEPALKAARPKIGLNIFLGVVVGLAVGVGLAFFIEYLDTSVKTIDDVERALQAPVLGVIPQNVGSLIEEGPDSPHAEAYRVLRTNILFSLKDPKLNTITIVSAGAGEGKSTTIFNLATIFAQQGSRVVIVDSDLRRPSLHKILNVSNSIGLTNYLLKQNTLEEVIQTSPMSTLDFMPSGKLPSSSMGILSSTQMKELIRDLKRRYDYVFFDSPPIMGVSDASILASEVDCVMQVIQYRRYPQPMTIRAKQMIEKVGGNLLGIVLNNINLSSDENYYYYSGYYYDYYSKSDDSKPEDETSELTEGVGRDEDQVEIKPKY